MSSCPYREEGDLGGRQCAGHATAVEMGGLTELCWKGFIRTDP